MNLSLAQLEAFDPAARKSGRETRYLCPLCSDGGSRRGANRNLSVSHDGKWQCFRCHAKGLLEEFRTAAPGKGSPRPRKRAVMKGSLCSPTVNAPSPVVRPEVPPPPKSYDFGTESERLAPLEGTPGEAYLRSRAIPAELAAQTGAKFSPSFMGRPAVVFPLTHPATGELVAWNARYTDGRTPKTRTIKRTDGPHGGIFATAPDALASPLPVVVEAPIDALTLALCGVPSVATIGTTLPESLALRLALRPCALAYDGDEAGDKAAQAAAERVIPIGGNPSRLRPPRKDWNDVLAQDGRNALCAMLAPILGAIRPTAPSDRDKPPSGPVRPAQGHKTPSSTHQGEEERLACVVFNEDGEYLETPEGEVLMYRASLGELRFDTPRDIWIAGKVRSGIRWVYPQIEAAYAHADRVAASKNRSH